MRRNRKVIGSILTALGLAFGSCSGINAKPEAEPPQQLQSPGNHRLTIVVQGSQREVMIHIPKGYSAKQEWPLIIMFHGGGGTARAAMFDTGWTRKADKEGFLVVFPEGSPPDPSRPGNFRKNPQTWNDGSKQSRLFAVKRNVPDIAFISAMLSHLKTRLSVNPKRIDATGFSNGASMSFRAARELSREIAAIAPVAGADWMTDRAPDRVVPILYITGTADPLNPMDGGEIHIGARSYGSKPVVQEMISEWAGMHGCPKKSKVVYEMKGSKKLSFCQAADTERVIFISLQGHGHFWPGGKINA